MIKEKQYGVGISLKKIYDGANKRGIIIGRKKSKASLNN